MVYKDLEDKIVVILERYFVNPNIDKCKADLNKLKDEIGDTTQFKKVWLNSDKILEMVNREGFIIN